MLRTLQKQIWPFKLWACCMPQSSFSTAQATKTTTQKVQPAQPELLKQKTKKLTPQKTVARVQTIHDKMEEVKIDPVTGVVTHGHLVSKDGLSRRTFPSVEVFDNWLLGQKRRIKQDLRQKLTPLQYFVTQGKGIERAFTGAYWETKDVGIYNCVVCTQRLFMFDHKFSNTSGYPTFWNGIKDSVKFEDDNLKVPESPNAVEDPLLQFKTPIKRCTCSNCEAHLGYLFADGPAPLGLRFQISSAALSFQKKGWFEIPKLDKEQYRKVKQEKEQTADGLRKFQQLLDDEKSLGMENYLVRAKQQKERQAAQEAEPIKQTSLFDAKGIQSKN